MDDRSHLHDAEVLLCSLHSSPAMMLWLAVRGLVDALVIGAVLSVLAFLISFFGFETSLSVWFYVGIFIIVYLYVLWQRHRTWKHAKFRITSERILVQDPRAFFHGPLHTIKWLQYQESSTGHRNVFDFFFLSRPLHIRYGTADARFEVEFPSLRFASDVKHYLDKVDSAVRRNDIASVKPFVAKAKGKRDLEQE